MMLMIITVFAQYHHAEIYSLLLLDRVFGRDRRDRVESIVLVLVVCCSPTANIARVAPPKTRLPVWLCVLFAGDRLPHGVVIPVLWCCLWVSHNIMSVYYHCRTLEIHYSRHSMQAFLAPGCSLYSAAMSWQPTLNAKCVLTR